ncbi:hypothetical protein [Flavobacterium sp. 1]|uniref:hypothetical protein n=1 Tax=Flavobacterium sp. 1 TaxID=2035200 RepID=UPI0012FD7A9A|nr:hypothetical protein [Flavobacterium sp. 1]
MPELELKYLDSKKLFFLAEMVISDVCADCNNTKLSKLDTYFCSLYDTYFKEYHEEKKPFNFIYDYELLLRSLLKITYNSSRTVSREGNFLEKFKKFILDGAESSESIVVKLDIITPALSEEGKFYPKSARCGTFDVGIITSNFHLRVISVNSFYFYILISNDDLIQENVFSELQSLIERIPGTIIHPYKTETFVNNFSRDDAHSIHIDFITRSSEGFIKV